MNQIYPHYEDFTMNKDEHLRSITNTSGLSYPDLLRWWALAVEDGLNENNIECNSKENDPSGEKGWIPWAPFTTPPGPNPNLNFRRRPKPPAWHNWPKGKEVMVQDFGCEGWYELRFYGVSPNGKPLTIPVSWTQDPVEWDEIREPTVDELARMKS